MTIITDQVQAYAEQLEVLNEISATLFHKKFMKLFDGTKVGTVTMQSVSHPTVEGAAAHSFNLGPCMATPGDYVHANYTFTQKADGSYDMMEHGNDGIMGFIECAIEYSVWQEIMDELAANSTFLYRIYNLGTDENQVVWTRDAYWVADVKDDTESE